MRTRTYNQGVGDLRFRLNRKLRRMARATIWVQDKPGKPWAAVPRWDAKTLSELQRYLAAGVQRANQRPGGAGRH